MSGIRWKVEQEFNWLNGTYWIAWRPSEGWKALAPKFPTHAEALAYADQQARTVTLELPPVKPGRQKFLQNSYLRGVALDQVVQLVDMADHECIYIDKFDWKELGEYLLALHYHHERNQK